MKYLFLSVKEKAFKMYNKFNKDKNYVQESAHI